jgi:hypothetical protein
VQTGFDGFNNSPVKKRKEKQVHQTNYWQRRENAKQWRQLPQHHSSNNKNNNKNHADDDDKELTLSKWRAASKWMSTTYCNQTAVSNHHLPPLLPTTKTITTASAANYHGGRKYACFRWIVCFRTKNGVR